MAIFKNNPFPGVDASQYLNWAQVVLPNGEIYYQVPGHPGYVYDPVASNATGRVVFRANPKDSIAKQQEEEKRLRELQEQQKQNSSLVGQATPVLAATGGALLANELMSSGIGRAPATAQQVIPGTSNILMSDGTIKGPTGQIINTATPAQAAAQGAVAKPATPSVVGAARIPGATPTAVGSATLPDGSSGILMSDGSIQTNSLPAGTEVTPDGSIVNSTTGQTVGRAVQGLAGAYQMYQGYQDYKEGNYLGAGINTAVGANMLGNAAGSTYALGAQTLGGQALGAVGGLYGAYQTDKMVGSMPAGGRRNTNATMSGAAAGAAIGSVVPVIGTGVGALIGGMIGFADSYFGSSKNPRQMIRDEGRKHLQKNGLIDQEWKGTLADGSKFDYGKDGKGFGHLDYDDPTTGKIIALANVIAAGEGNHGEAKEAMAALYANAALSNSGGDYNKALSNIQHMARQRGFSLPAVQGQLDKMKQENLINENEYAVYSNDAKTVMGQGMDVPPPKTQAQAAAQGARPPKIELLPPAPGQFNGREVVPVPRAPFKPMAR